MWYAYGMGYRVRWRCGMLNEDKKWSVEDNCFFSSEVWGEKREWPWYLKLKVWFAQSPRVAVKKKSEPKNSQSPFFPYKSKGEKYLQPSANQTSHRLRWRRKKNVIFDCPKNCLKQQDFWWLFISFALEPWWQN